MITVQDWLENPWLCWGLGPVVAGNIGFFSTMILLEFIGSRCPSSAMLNYSSRQNRKAEIKELRKKFSFSEQLRYCFWTMIGPTVILSAALNTLICNSFIPYKQEMGIFPSVGTFVLQLIVMLLIGDPALYWGHRIQHMSPFLWKHCHSFHHQVATPTPVSTLFIDSTDAMLQGGLPLLLAAWAVSPHPLCFYCYVMLRLADNAANHSGLRSSWWADIITLKCLPLRASVAHHRFSNYSQNAKNFGEYFWLWDWLFGTLGGAALAAK